MPTVYAENICYDLTGETSAEISDVGEPRLTIKGKSVHTLNLSGSTLEVYDLTGKLVYSTRIDSNDKTTTLSLGKGVYVVKVEKLTGKIIVK